MNSSPWRWLLDLDVIPPDAEHVNLVWERPFGPWLWTLLLIGAAALAFWSYSRLHGHRAGRWVLATVRSLLIVLVLVVLSGPMLELPREIVEPDWVLMLVDRSESMTVEDAQTNDSATARRSRDAQLEQLLRTHNQTWSELSDNRTVLWLGFHNGAFNLERIETDGESVAEDQLPAQLGEPTGQRTRVARALEQALQRAAARPISGIVVFSDGRTDDPPDRSLLRRLQANQVQVYTVPLGSTRPLGDLAVRRIDAPQRAFVRDKVPVIIDIDRLGVAAGQLDATVRLIDELTGEELDAAALEAGDETEQITLTATPNLTGEATWKVVVETEQPDLIPENNVKTIMVELVDRPLNVLFVEGYPRWEYRYVKNLLVREKSIESSVMLTSADRDFAQEGNQPITRLPRSPGEFAEYDVLIIGDVPGSFFSPDQLEMMRQHVSERGAGLLWIGGERYTPNTYGTTVLADLLPIRGSLNVPPIGSPVTMQPTDLAERLGVLQLVTEGGVGWPRELRDPSYNWSSLSYAQRIEPGQLKPTAVPLAETVGEFDGAHLPLVIHMRYGAGQIVYVATDEIWRWRYGRGEALTEQFWVQIVRMLGRESLAVTGDRAVITATPRRVETGQPARIEVRLLDEQLIDAADMSLTAVIETDDGQRIAEVELPQVEGAEDRYAATYLLDRPGAYRIRLTHLQGIDQFTEATLDIVAPDDEMRRPETDHGLLAELSSATGGAVLEPAAIGSLPDLLPNRSIRTLNPLTERIWDTPLVLALALLLLTLEWIGRKLVRLA